MGLLGEPHPQVETWISEGDVSESTMRPRMVRGTHSELMGKQENAQKK